MVDKISTKVLPLLLKFINIFIHKATLSRNIMFLKGYNSNSQKECFLVKNERWATFPVSFPFCVALTEDATL